MHPVTPHEEIFEVVRQVLVKAETRPADAALREILRPSRLRPDEKRMVSQVVFAYFRWLGWLDKSRPLHLQLEQALTLAESFRLKPSSFNDRELVERALPSWLRDFMTVSPALVRELQNEPHLWLRARPGHGQELARALGDCEPHPIIHDALCYQGDQDLYTTPEFHSGQFEIQDLSSQLVGHLCAPEPGQTWWDACAGEGGKTLHLCDLMQNKGTVWATDPAQWRLDILKRRAARAKLFNFRMKAWQPGGQLPIKTKFDGILVDAPCTGIGTWGRNPHARWTTRPSDVLELAQIQREILAKVANSLKPGGKLIYSVCTLARPETSEIADFFEATHVDFQPLTAANPISPAERASRLKLLPEQAHANGMFVALWRK